jgi:retron-type reverse transcriptase
MPFVVVQLEQRIERGRLERELEQRSDELEQQCRFSRGLRLLTSNAEKGESGATGMRRPALSEIGRENSFLVGRNAENQEGSIMKRKGDLFATVFSKENIYQAYIDARHGKRKKAACFVFETRLGANLEALYSEINSGCYRPRPYFKFTVYEPKDRIVYGPAFRDIVAQHAIYRVVYPIFNRTFIDTSFACRVGYGTHRASDYLQAAMRACGPDDYTLKLDVRKFFYSIDRSILRRLIERKIKDRRLIDVMMMYAEMDSTIGIPIGNLLSQLYALIYLNPLDHYIKRVLKIGRYVRYVDDIVLIGLNRQQCLDYRAAIVQFLRNELHLELSKSTIAKVRRGVNFVGYRTWRSKRFIRKFSLYKFRRKAKIGDDRAVVSLLGHAKRTASIVHMLKILEEAKDANIIQLSKKWKRT